MKYVYPAVFTKNPNGIDVSFPDLSDVYTSGANEAEALEMAEDVLNLMLCEKEENGVEIPKASDIRAISTDADQFTSLISADTSEYRKKYNSKAIKKNVTIPAWLDALAERAGINYSATLQEGLKKNLGL